MCTCIHFNEPLYISMHIWSFSSAVKWQMFSRLGRLLHDDRDVWLFVSCHTTHTSEATTDASKAPVQQPNTLTSFFPVVLPSNRAAVSRATHVRPPQLLPSDEQQQQPPPAGTQPGSPSVRPAGLQPGGPGPGSSGPVPEGAPQTQPPSPGPPGHGRAGPARWTPQQPPVHGGPRPPPVVPPAAEPL